MLNAYNPAFHNFHRNYGETWQENSATSPILQAIILSINSFPTELASILNYYIASGIAYRCMPIEYEFFSVLQYWNRKMINVVYKSKLRFYIHFHLCINLSTFNLLLHILALFASPAPMLSFTYLPQNKRNDTSYINKHTRISNLIQFGFQHLTYICNLKI